MKLTLRKRCLLTINDENELTMHDLIWDMGKRIVRNKFPKEPGKQSRLWSCEDICNVLKNYKGTEEIEGIIPDNCGAFNKVLDEVPLKTEMFKKMHRLRLLIIDFVHLTGSFEHIFEELRCLSWRRCPLEHFPSDFHPEKLVFLDLQLSKLKILWDGKLFLQHLKILNLGSYELLTTTPDFTGVPCLENLNLNYCESLVEVHPSIGCLSRLVYLNLSSCVNLRILPSSICNLRAMKSLDLDYCSSLEELPEEFGNIESLHELSAVSTEIRKLPDSIGRLTKLVELDLSGCNNLRTLPSNTCDLRLLDSLVLDRCENLEELPTELGNIESLRKLSAEETSISKLPYSIGRLSKLVELDVSYCEMLRYIPSSICNLRSLEQLDLWGCSNLECLPKDLGNIESLKKLRAGETKLRKIPDSIGDMKKLEILSLNHVSPSSANFVRHSVSGLCAIKTLDLGQCQLVDRDIPNNIGSLSSLQDLKLCLNDFYSLPSSLTQLSSLKLLDLTRCENLQSLSGLPPNLQRLYATKCTSMQKLPNLSNLIHLEELYLTDCSRLAEIHGLEKLSSITKINMGGCSNLTNTFIRQSFFQVYSGFGNEIEILLPTTEIPDWFSHQKTFDVPNSSLFGGMILWAVGSGCFDIEAVIDNITVGTKWTCQNWLSTSQVHSWVKIIPKTKLSLNSGDRIEVSFREIGGYVLSSCDVHLVYDRDVEEISYGSKRLKL